MSEPAGLRFRPGATGFYGKLPARGDFLRAGLPETCIAPLDAWCRECLTASRAELGQDWADAWMQAPIWRFLLPQGACGPWAMLGIWLPSMDKVGRHFPFILAALAEDISDLQQGGGFVDAAQAAGLAGVVEDAPHDRIGQILQAGFTEKPLPPPGWWSEGSPLVTPTHRDILTLFPVAEAGAMLRDPVAAGAA